LKAVANAVLEKIGEKIVVADSQVPAIASARRPAESQIVGSGNVGQQRRRKAGPGILAQREGTVLPEEAV
jgi:hypothetical protein